eukprot:147680-Chlamydomonas_euryale.AAC.1
MHASRGRAAHCRQISSRIAAIMYADDLAFLTDSPDDLKVILPPGKCNRNGNTRVTAHDGQEYASAYQRMLRWGGGLLDGGLWGQGCPYAR